jgi:hypothetical protein
MHQPRLYKTSLSFKGENTMIKDFKLEILILFYLPITKHWSPYQTTHIFLIPLSNWAILMTLKVLGEGIQILLKPQKQQRNNVRGFDLLCLFTCSLTGLSTLVTFFFLLTYFHHILNWQIWFRLIQRIFHGKNDPNSPDFEF